VDEVSSWYTICHSRNNDELHFNPEDAHTFKYFKHGFKLLMSEIETIANGDPTNDYLCRVHPSYFPIVCH
jgi:hypothetical protein